jgi:glycosyltransferase involved in cell wall biosynthesis
MPEVTVLTAVKNGERHLPETIDSIRNQTYSDWEYIIVDDKSTDNTVKLVQVYQEQDDRIRLIQLDESIGPFGAANIGLKHANGRYIIRTDADDLSALIRIEEQIKFLENNKSIRACGSYGKLIDENSEETGYKFIYPTKPDILKWYLCLHCPIIHSSLCIEKKAILEIGGYKELPASQDYRMFTDISRRGWLSVLPLDLVMFRNHPLRLSNTLISVKQVLFAQEIIQDHIFELSGYKWRKEEVEMLYKFGLSEHLSIRKGLKIARKWKKLWRNDDSLSNADMKTLESIYTKKKRGFMRKNAKKQPLSFLFHIFYYL